MLTANYKIGKRMVKCYIPMTESERRQGLMHYPQILEDGVGMLFLPPCRLHTHGMKFPIDVIELAPQTSLWPEESVTIISKTQMIPEGVTLEESLNPLIELAGGWCLRNL